MENQTALRVIIETGLCPNDDAEGYLTVGNDFFTGKYFLVTMNIFVS